VPSRPQALSRPVSSSANAQVRLASATMRRHYARSPIVEAVVEIRASLPEGVDDAALTAVRAGDEGRYHEVLPVLQSAVNITLDATGSSPPTTSATAQRAGFLFRGQTELFQATRDGLSYHKLAPYSEWESRRDEARRLWVKYRQTVHPSRLIRLGLRYVNRLDLPAPGELKDYLLTFPELAPGLPQLLSGYMMQLSIPQPDMPGAVLVVREGLVGAPRPGVASVLLDLDLAHVVDLAGDRDDFWQVFEHLHTRQLETFESCITDKTRELIS
jgi:uncharacterized protein (TIGR04255 family)